MRTWNPIFWMIRACFLAANLDSTSLLAPVQTILPELNISAVVLGSLIRIMTAANRLGLYSAFLACNAIFFKSSLHPRFTVDTMFLLKKINWIFISFELILKVHSSFNLKKYQLTKFILTSNLVIYNNQCNALTCPVSSFLHSCWTN